MVGGGNFQDLLAKLTFQSDTEGLLKTQKELKKVMEQMEGVGQASAAMSKTMNQTNMRGLRSAIGAMGEDKMSQILQGTEEDFQRVMNDANNAANGMDHMAGSIEETGIASKRSGDQMQKMMNIGMNTLFLGMALNMVFGRLAGKMFKMTGASAAFGAAAKSVLLPFFLAITPLLIKFAMIMMDMPRFVKLAAGAFVFMMAVIAPLMMMMGQLALASMATEASMLSLATSITAVTISVLSLFAIIALVYAIFKKFGPVAGTVAAIIGGALTAAIFSATGATGVFSGALATATTQLGINTAAVTGAASSLYAYAAGALSAAISGTITLATATWSLVSAYSSLLLPIGALALGLLLLNRIFKKFGPVVGLIATILGGVLLAALSPIAAVILTIFGAFKAVNKIFKKFGKIAGAIAGVIVAAIGVIIAIFASVPVGIGLAIGAVLAIIWNFKDQIWSAIQAVIGFIADLAKGIANWLGQAGKTLANWVSDFVGFLKKLPRKAGKFIGNLIDFFKKLPSKIVNAVTGLASSVSSIGEDIVDGIVNGITSMGSAIKDALFGLLPDKLTNALDKAASAGSSLVGSVADVLQPNDFILSGGKMIQPDKRDTIVGMKPGGALDTGGGGKTVEVNINDPVMKEDVDVQSVVDEVEDRVDRNTRGRSGGLT